MDARTFRQIVLERLIRERAGGKGGSEAEIDASCLAPVAAARAERAGFSNSVDAGGPRGNPADDAGSLCRRVEEALTRALGQRPRNDGLWLICPEQGAAGDGEGGGASGRPRHVAVQVWERGSESAVDPQATSPSQSGESAARPVKNSDAPCTVWVFRPTSEKGILRFEVRRESDIAPVVDRVHAAVLALCDAEDGDAGDALREHRDGIGRVTVSARVDENAGAVRLSVSDDGPGMPKEEQRRCFEPYFTTKTRGMSTGLGLSFVRGVVTKAGGQVKVESRVGKGTTFTLVLPAEEAAADENGSQGTERLAAFVSIADLRLRAYVESVRCRSGGRGTRGGGAHSLVVRRREERGAAGGSDAGVPGRGTATSRDPSGRRGGRVPGVEWSGVANGGVARGIAFRGTAGAAMAGTGK